MKKLFVIALSALVLAACGNGTLSLMDYNEKAVTIFTAASEKMYNDREMLFDKQMTKEEAQAIVAGLNTDLDARIAELSALKYPEDAAGLHECLVGIMNFEKETIMPLLAQTTEKEYQSEEWYALWNQFDEVNKTVDSMLDKMGTLQQELADKAGATLK